MPTPEQPLTPRSASEPGTPTNQKSSGRLAITIGIVFVVLIAAGFWWAQNHKGITSEKELGGKHREAAPIPVIDGTVMQKDVPIYLEGLGTVQAFNTVTIRSRVDGQLLKVVFEEGQDVQAGDLLVQIDPAPYKTQLAQAEAKKGQDEAQLSNAKVDLQRYEELLKNEGVTQQVYDTQKAMVRQLEATIKADQAAIDSVKVQLDYTTIRSPIDGRVGIRQVDQGNMVHANDANGLVVITQLKPISIVFTLPQQMLEKIQMEIAKSGPELKVLAIGQDDATIEGEGTLAVIDNQIDTTTSTIKLKATFPNTDLRLWPGEFVTARLLLTVRKDSTVVPASVVQRGPQGAFVFVILENQTVEVRNVKVAQIEQGEALIDEGLQPGEKVVVDGQYKLQQGSKIRIQDLTTSEPKLEKVTKERPNRPAGSEKKNNGKKIKS